MKLASKLVLLCLAAMLVMTAVFSYVTIKRDAARFTEEHDRDALAVAEALSPLISKAWKEGGHDALAKEFGERGSDYSHVSVRYVRIDTPRIPELQPLAPPELLNKVVTKESLTVTFADNSGTHNVHTYVPVDVNSEGRLEVTREMENHKRHARDTVLKTLMLLSAVSLACICVVVGGGVRMIGRPLERLVKKAKQVGAGEFGESVKLKGNTELNQLADAMNDMSDQLATQRSTIEQEAAARFAAENQLRHAERLNTVGRLAAGVAHEMGTPLNVVAGRAALIASGKLNDDDVQSSAQTIKDEADRITTIVRGLLDFARRNEPNRDLIDPSEVIEQTIRLLGSFSTKKNVDVRSDLRITGTVANADAGQIQQVLTNLVMNAIQATESGGSVTVELSAQRLTPPSDVSGEEGDFLCIAVRDTGCGIPPESLNSVFEPFFTTKDVGEGTGLGLAIAYGIIQDHDGWIHVDSEPNAGSCFSIFIPVAIRE